MGVVGPRPGTARRGPPARCREPDGARGPRSGRAARRDLHRQRRVRAARIPARPPRARPKVASSIFSDHHMGFDGSRHDFFSDSGNSELYAEALTAYADAGFTLVENGDVEELVIHEPASPPPEVALADARRLRAGCNSRRSSTTTGTCTSRSTGSSSSRAATSGSPATTTRISRTRTSSRCSRPCTPRSTRSTTSSSWSPPTDDAGRHVGHGHHFDTASTPLYAPEIGEMLSECLGWAYEGADRVWRWGNGDGVEEWAGGSEAFNNTLVTDEPDRYQLSSDTVAELTDTLEALFLPPSHGTRSRARSSRSYPPCWPSCGSPACSRTCSTATSPGSTSAARIPGKRCSTRSSAETGGSSSATSTRSSSTSSSTSDRRERVRVRPAVPAARAFARAAAPLVEPGDRYQSDRYLNCGSAGRFQNLIWCTEIIDGVPQIAAWHRPGGPESGASGRAAHVRARTRRRGGNAHRVRRARPGSRSRGGRGGAQDVAAACPAHDDDASR